MLGFSCVRADSSTLPDSVGSGLSPQGLFAIVLIALRAMKTAVLRNRKQALLPLDGGQSTASDIPIAAGIKKRAVY